MLTKAEIQQLRALREKKNREQAGLFVVEGVKTVQDLLAAGMKFEAVYATPAWQGFCTQHINESDMARMSHYPTPSSVLAVGKIERREITREELTQGYTLALDGVQDPGNVGTLVRVADWYGISRVLLGQDCADLFSQKVINASMCSFARVPVHRVDLAAMLAESPIPVLGCDLAGEDIHTTTPPQAAVIVIGSEGRGVSEPVRRCVTRWVTIPRIGKAESLNAALAGAIVCDNLRRDSGP